MPHLEVRRKIHVAEQMYDIINGNHPQECKDLFAHLNSTKIRNTRTESENLLVIPKRKLVTTERCIRYFGAIIWNSIPCYMRQLPAKALFKAAIRAPWL